ncbi:MAG TPA: type II secretion system minor pseudopilin GspJ [Spongiibacteraceae bacterium]|nr:type II secretion system minor pseudopilin GspJ [Spongiibacteraceae bacterium]
MKLCASQGTVRGFTLLEVLLAMAITAMVAVMAYAGLSAAINAASRHGEMVQRLGDVQTAISWLVRDLRESVERPIVDAHDEMRPALIGGTGDDELLELTRSGWDNPRGQRRSALQRVHYRLDADHNLWRDNWLVLDRIDDEDHLQQVKLLTGVQSFTVQFLNGQSQNAAQQTLGGEWVDHWPQSPSDTEKMPTAVRFDIDIDGIGVIHRVVGLAGEQQTQ